jgi:hypothetical protein
MVAQRRPADDPSVRSTLDERRQWSEAHPWATGCWFSACVGVALGLVVGAQSGLRFGLLTAFSVPVWGVPLMALAIQHGWLQRAGASAAPTPRLGRPWSRTSDRWVSAVGVAAVVGLAFSAVDAVTGDDGPLWAATRLVAYGYLVITVLAERRQRAPLARS